MLFSYNWLKQYIDLTNISAQKVGELLTLHSFEVESIKKNGNDWILDVDVLANRGHDCRCHLAIAMELAAILGKKPKQNYQNLASQKITLAQAKLKPVNIKVQSSKQVSRYAALVIENIKVAISPKWLVDYLEAIGLRSINNVVDLTNYIMCEVGQPMHAFDYDKILALSSEGKMIVRLSRQGEKVVTLDGVERELPTGILVIEAGKKLIDLAGIMGGQASEIGPETKNIILQAACFDGPTIRRATKLLGHRTDASDIYQHNIDPNLADLALGRSLHLLKEVTGLVRVVQKIDFYPEKKIAKQIKLDLAQVNSLLGVELSRDKIIQILQSLDFVARKSDSDASAQHQSHPEAPRIVARGKLRAEGPHTKSIIVLVPIRRLDVVMPEDLIEEIGRIYGYEKIPAKMPYINLAPPEINQQAAYKNQIRQSLINWGFNETINYVFTPHLFDERRIYRQKGEGFTGQNGPSAVPLQNPIAKDKICLRMSLIPGLAQNIKNNLKYFSAIRLFEIGRIWCQNLNQNKQLIIHEKESLAGVLLCSDEKEPFFVLKGFVENLIQSFGISDIWFDDALAKDESAFLENDFNVRALAQIKTGDRLLGYCGELRDFAESSAVGFELDLDVLTQETISERMYEPLAKYPSSVRDLAILVPPKTKVGQVLGEINELNVLELIDVDLFDLYQGEELDDKKNLAFHLIFQSSKKTLTDREVDGFMAKIIKNLQEKGWEIRK